MTREGKDIEYSYCCLQYMSSQNDNQRRSVHAAKKRTCVIGGTRLEVTCATVLAVSCFFRVAIACLKIGHFRPGRMWRCMIARRSFLLRNHRRRSLELSSSVGPPRFTHLFKHGASPRFTCQHDRSISPGIPSQSLPGTACCGERCRSRVASYHDARVELTLNIAGRGPQTQPASPFQVPWCQSLTKRLQCAMTSRRTPHRLAHPFPAPPSTQPVLFSHSTFTFIASWQGQLLVCTAVLFLGAIYFFVRRPVEDWRTRRRERLARAREKELMAMENNADDKAASSHSTIEDRKEEVKMNAKERGRERRKEVKKYKSVLLKADSNILTSAESSPALPPTSFSVSSHDPSSRALCSVPPSSLNDQGSSRQAEPRTPSRALPSPPTLVPPKSPNLDLESQNAASLKENRNVYGDSDASREPVSDRDQKQGEIGIVPKPSQNDLLSKPVPSSKSESSSSPRSRSQERVEIAEPSSHHLEPADSHERKDAKAKSHGFSIFPEEGYLPVPVGHAGGKKKKKKGKSSVAVSATEKNRKEAQNLTPPSVTGPASQSLDSEMESSACPQEIESPALALDYNSNSSEADIAQPALTARDALVESLRTELGVSKAEQAKAMDELIRARSNEERMKGEMEKVRRGAKEIKRNDKDDVSLSVFLWTDAENLLAATALQQPFKDVCRRFEPPLTSRVSRPRIRQLSSSRITSTASNARLSRCLRTGIPLRSFTWRTSEGLLIGFWDVRRLSKSGFVSFTNASPCPPITPSCPSARPFLPPKRLPCTIPSCELRNGPTFHVWYR